MYEVDFGLAADASLRNQEFVACLPETEVLFGEPEAVSSGLAECAAMLEERNFPFRAMGTKILWLDESQLSGLGGSPCLYIVCDPRTWAMKDKICKEFYPLHYPDWGNNLLPPLNDYMKRLVMVHALPNRLIITLEDLLADSQRIVAKIATSFSLEDCEPLMRE